MRFKDFEIRPYKSLNGLTSQDRYELIKWYKTESPIEVTIAETGEKKMKDTFCYVVAWITWNPKEPCWEFESVGMRFIDDYEEGLCEYIKKFVELLDVIRDKENPDEDY